MRLILRLLKVGSLLVVALLLLGAAILFFYFPRTEPPSPITIQRTPERVERGRYLVNHVASCLNCHSERDWSLYAGPVRRDTQGMGAPLRVLRPKISSANITPYGVGEMTDGELVRSITSGINRKGGALHPFMPYDTYAKMTEEDVLAVVAYLRTLPSIHNEVPAAEDNPFLMLLARVLPKPYEPPLDVDRSDTVAYGNYLTDIAECSFCHGADFSGGRSFQIPGSILRVEAANLTSHADGALASWKRENFIGVFKSFDNPESREIHAAGDNTVMPWLTYAGMTEQDLGAIFEYLVTLPPTPSKPGPPTVSPALGDQE